MLKKRLNHTLLTALGALFIAPTMAHASLITTTTDVNFSVTGSVSDPLPGQTSASNGATTSSNATLGTTQINQFNANTGVLTGVNVNLTSKQTQTTFVTTKGGTAGNNSTSGSASGTGSSTVKLVIPTSVSSATNTVSVDDSCSDKQKNACNGTSSFQKVDDNLTVSSSDLNKYVGTGSFGVNQVATEIKADTTANSFGSDNTATTKSTVDWAGTLSATYTYLLHAAQSFDPLKQMLSLTLDFGTVYLGDSVADKAFGISNLTGDRVGLSLTDFKETGDTNNLFSTNLSTFSNLAQGATNDTFKASFLANSVGDFSATYLLTLADFAPNVAYATDTLGSGYGLTLNVKGNVIERPPVNDVPEPGSVALFGLGAAALSLLRKRRQA